MFGGDTNFDDLDLGRGFDHPVTDAGGLGYTIARMQADGVTLIFVKNINPALVAENELKSDRVIVHHIRDWAAIRDADVTGNDRPTKPGWDQIAVMHPGAADDPRCLITQAAYGKFMLCCRLFNGW